MEPPCCCFMQLNPFLATSWVDWCLFIHCVKVQEKSTSLRKCYVYYSSSVWKFSQNQQFEKKDIDVPLISPGCEKALTLSKKAREIISQDVKLLYYFNIKVNWTLHLEKGCVQMRIWILGLLVDVSSNSPDSCFFLQQTWLSKSCLICMFQQKNVSLFSFSTCVKMWFICSE